MSKYCSIRCKTADSPSSECECSCGGKCHGSLSKSVEEYGDTVNLNDSNPFHKLKFDDEGITKENKRETLADSDEFSIEDIEVGDIVDVLYHCPKNGWVRHNKIEVEKVSDNSIGGEKPDGFFETWNTDEIPVSQEHFRNLIEGDTQ